ncbi:uncharacterized protein LOC142544345 [Primulina tabacum]|uniref:uncharacterized protein LOC142544345 n=1 Tax=Primulina tabacum TaxID=48773 RepID=UPI003F5A42B1
MARTRRTNQDNSKAPEDGAQTSAQTGVHTTGSNLITMSPMELARIVSEAVKQAMARKEVSHQTKDEGLGRAVGEPEYFPVAKGCSFVDIIVRELLPGNFKSAKVKDYDGNADPEEHLARFENMAMLHCYTDRIKCKVFLTILVDSAQRWFEGLAPQGIHSFKNFQKVFSHHFSSSKKYKKTAFNIFEVKQSPEESLRAYIRRFNRVALDVSACATETKTTAFTQGLREGEFFKSLTKKVPGDFEDLLSWAEKYINMEEAQKQKREAVRKERGDRVSKPKEKGQRRGKTGHFSHHVPLKIAREREVQECSRDLAPDYQLSLPEKRGFFTLHKVYYHNTEDCKTLKGNYVLPSVPGPSQANKRP